MDRRAALGARLGVLALALGLVIALLPLHTFRIPRARRRSRGSTAYPALHRIRGGDRRPTRNGETDPATRPYGACIAAARNKRWLCCVPAAIATHVDLTVMPCGPSSWSR